MKKFLLLLFPAIALQSWGINVTYDYTSESNLLSMGFTSSEITVDSYVYNQSKSLSDRYATMKYHYFCVGDLQSKSYTMLYLCSGDEVNERWPNIFWGGSVEWVAKEGYAVSKVVVESTDSGAAQQVYIICGSNLSEIATYTTEDAITTCEFSDEVRNFAVCGDLAFIKRITVNYKYTDGPIGDVNGDNKVDIEDVNAAINIILEMKQASDYPGDADLNGDNKFDIEDVNALINIILDVATPDEPGVTTFTVNGVSFKMVDVEGGTFTMGATAEQGSDPDFWGEDMNFEKPVHQVTLSSFAIGATEVTQELWQAVTGENPSLFSSANGYAENLQRPVENVYWSECRWFITKLNQLTGKTFRLPTEAEWEYAARGGKKSKSYKYAGSNTIGNVAWYYGNAGNEPSASDYGTHTVGTKAPNELGLYDMSGNVYEWCEDRFDIYSSEAQTNPTGPDTGSSNVIRGGSYSVDALLCRVSWRSKMSYTEYSNRRKTRPVGWIGFRLVLSK